MNAGSRWFVHQDISLLHRVCLEQRTLCDLWREKVQESRLFSKWVLEILASMALLSWQQLFCFQSDVLYVVGAAADQVLEVGNLEKHRVCGTHKDHCGIAVPHFCGSLDVGIDLSLL